MKKTITVIGIVFLSVWISHASSAGLKIDGFQVDPRFYQGKYDPTITIEGTVTNGSGRSYAEVTIYFAVYDASGGLMGTGWDLVCNKYEPAFAPGQVKQFRCWIMEVGENALQRVKTYKCWMEWE